ncbi:MAG TPA: SOS response-associated peptidase [Blastocatellia bacterium]|nr:SOS response-associated peptidase [Blastocatellia bacterium]
MCGRFVRRKTMPEIAEEFGVEEIVADLKPSYNIAPTQEVAMVISDGGRKLLQARWGLIPAWADDPSIGNRMINARAETVTQKASFKNPFRKQRCLIVADGFYEWMQAGRGKKPFFIHLKSGRSFGFAGLYENWLSPERERITTCTIITTDANELMKPIHQRMPVIIPKEKEDLWLDPAQKDESALLDLLKPYPSNLMEAYEVSRVVNTPANNSPACLEPVAP